MACQFQAPTKSPAPRRRSCSCRTACQMWTSRSSSARWTRLALRPMCSEIRGRSSLLNGPRMMTPSRSKLITRGSRPSGSRRDRSIHDPVDHATLHIDDVHVAGWVLAERADFDGLVTKLDALPALVAALAQG